MSSATTRIYCTTSPPISGAMEDWVRVQQLQMLYRRRCCMSASQLTTHVRLVVEHSRRSRASATRRQSSVRYGGEMPDNNRWTRVATLKSKCWR